MTGTHKTDNLELKWRIAPSPGQPLGNNLLLQYQHQKDRNPRGSNQSFRGRNGGPTNSGSRQTPQGGLQTPQGRSIPLGYCLSFHTEGPALLGLTAGTSTNALTAINVSRSTGNATSLPKPPPTH